MPPFQPPRDWDAVFAASDDYFFGEEPSLVARAALHGFRMFGGDPQGALALDLGSGEGRDTIFLAEAGFHVAARDIVPTGLEKTRSLMARRNVPADRVDLVLGDVRDFHYPQDAYDLAMAANVYQFLPPGEVPGHIARLQAATKPGGICAVGVFSSVMTGWGTDLTGFFAATGDELLAYFPQDGGWLLLDLTEYRHYRPPQDALGSWVFVVARKETTP
jgi:SAM-dependent methyltransferase